MDFISNFVSTPMQAGVFLMVAGIGSVFLVQVVFYFTVKIWPKPKEK